MIMTALQSEAEDNLRLKRANEFIEHCKQAEAEAGRELVRAREQSALARRKYEELFIECEKRKCERRKSGQIENKVRY